MKRPSDTWHQRGILLRPLVIETKEKIICIPRNVVIDVMTSDDWPADCQRDDIKEAVKLLEELDG